MSVPVNPGPRKHEIQTDALHPFYPRRQIGTTRPSAARLIRAQNFARSAIGAVFLEQVVAPIGSLDFALDLICRRHLDHLVGVARGSAAQSRNVERNQCKLRSARFLCSDSVSIAMLLSGVSRLRLGNRNARPVPFLSGRKSGRSACRNDGPISNSIKPVIPARHKKLSSNSCIYSRSLHGTASDYSPFGGSFNLRVKALSRTRWSY